MASIIKNKFLFIGIIVSLLAATVVFGAMAYKKSTEAPYMSGSVEKIYSTVNELESDSEIVAKIKVTDSKTFKYERVPFTLNKAKVNELYKGSDLTEINILETGGTIDGKKFSFEGSDVLTKDNEAIVYLKKYIGPVVAEDAYIITGEYAGRFKLDKTGKIIKEDAKQGELKDVKELKDLKLK